MKSAESGLRFRSAGYTVIELMIVLVILGLLLATTVVNLDGISPRYRLRGAARELGSTINWARSLSGGTGRTYTLHYDLDNRAYWIIEPPGPEDDPDLPLDERPRLPRNELPLAVEFDNLVLGDNRRVRDGTVDIEMDPLGHGGSHIVHLKNTEGGFLCLKFSSMLGFVDYSVEPLEFPEYR